MDQKKLLSLVMLLVLSFLTAIGASQLVLGKKISSEEITPCPLDQGNGCNERASSNQSNQSSAISRQVEGSDQTRPEDSIRVEGGKDIQLDNLAGNQTTSSSGSKPLLDSLKPGYRVKVTFDSFHVIANYEFDQSQSDLFGNGNEYYIYAYVQGKLIPLFTPHFNQEAVSVGGNYIINKEMTLDLSGTIPLSIMTVGYEKDECPYFNLPDNIQHRIVNAMNHPMGLGSINQMNKYPGLKLIHDDLNDKINSLCVQGNDKNEILGYINKVYPPTSYGVGHHTDEAGGQRPYPDFTLTYRIGVAAPPMDIKK